MWMWSNYVGIGRLAGSNFTQCKKPSAKRRKVLHQPQRKTRRLHTSWDVQAEPCSRDFMCTSLRLLKATAVQAPVHTQRFARCCIRSESSILKRRSGCRQRAQLAFSAAAQWLKIWPWQPSEKRQETGLQGWNSGLNKFKGILLLFSMRSKFLSGLQGRGFAMRFCTWLKLCLALPITNTLHLKTLGDLIH